MAIQRMKLGKFAQDSQGGLYGRISGLGIGSTVVMSQDAVSQDGKPYMKLIADSGNGTYEVGAAFQKEKDGKIYYSVSLESPLLLTSITAALFPDKENNGMFDLIWNRGGAFQPSADLTANGVQFPKRRFNGADATAIISSEVTPGSCVQLSGDFNRSFGVLLIVSVGLITPWEIHVLIARISRANLRVLTVLSR